jgi:hypothetical protein
MDDIINYILDPQQNEQVQVIFERTGDYGTFRDAIWMSRSEYDATTQETINAIKDERYQNWLAIVGTITASE